MRKLSLIIIFVSVIILNVYLNYRIEYLTKSKSLRDRNVERLKSKELNKKIKDLNNECKENGGIENPECRKKYLDFCIENADYHGENEEDNGENAEDNGSSLCTLYNKESSEIFVSLCGRAYGNKPSEKIKQQIIDSCNRPIDMADGDYIDNDGEEKIKKNFEEKIYAYARPTYDSSAFNVPESKNNNEYDNCNKIRNMAKYQWEKKNEKLKKLNLNKNTYNYFINELKKTKPNNCSMYSGVLCDSCDGCMWIGDECVEDKFSSSMNF